MADDSAATRFIIANAYQDWFEFLRISNPREVNFWVPSEAPVHVAPGTPWFYKMRGTTQIVGVGFLAAYSVMPLKMAWDTFGEANGVATFSELVRTISSLRAQRATAIS